MNHFDYSLLKVCGEDVFISSNAEIRRPHLVSIGNHVAIDSGFYCTTGLEIGDYVHLAPYITIIGGAEGLLKMNHFATLAAGSRVICISDEHLGAGLVGPRIPHEFVDHYKKGTITFEKFANVGTNVVIMPGVTLREGSVVGACSFVTADTEPWTIYLGVPAKPVKKRPKETILENAKKLGY